MKVGIKVKNSSLDTYPFSIYLKSILKELNMQTAKLFQNGQSQAVRLPKDFRFEGDSVFIRRIGKAVILQPSDNGWDTLFAALDEFSPDFMEDRAQPAIQNREDF